MSLSDHGPSSLEPEQATITRHRERPVLAGDEAPEPPNQRRNNRQPDQTANTQSAKNVRHPSISQKPEP